MPKTKAKVLAAIKEEETGNLLAKLQFNKYLPKVGEWITCSFGRRRTLPQNSLYWSYLTFLWNDCELKDEYSTVDDLHEMFKATFLSKRIFHGEKEFIKVGSTTRLDKQGFSEYLKQIDDAMNAYHGCNTAPFWQELEASKIGSATHKPIKEELAPF
jgi:hypothetical protein